MANDGTAFSVGREREREEKPYLKGERTLKRDKKRDRQNRQRECVCERKGMKKREKGKHKACGTERQ